MDAIEHVLAMNGCGSVKTLRRFRPAIIPRADLALLVRAQLGHARATRVMREFHGRQLVVYFDQRKKWVSFPARVNALVAEQYKKKTGTPPRKSGIILCVPDDGEPRFPYKIIHEPSGAVMSYGQGTEDDARRDLEAFRIAYGSNDLVAVEVLPPRAG